ncbi:hypothetical protein [Prochlorococcus marinus]|uniref:hypothetical protein n=1 Tax=Prochlorococcus marinus TaxID=1219 RepID=UPI0003094604|nr:hypothetical protein [Prochlorococcus marinus]
MITWEGGVNHLNNNLAGTETLTYYIHNASGYEEVGYGYGYTYSHSTYEVDYIVSVFNSIDTHIDLDFTRVYTYSGSDLDIYNLSGHSGWRDTYVGMTWTMGYGAYSWFDIAWLYTGDWEFDRNTIIHEIGHSLGLDHPGDNGYNPAYNSDDTVMSYNEGLNGWSVDWTQSDIDALVSIWGREDDYDYLDEPISNPLAGVLFEEGGVYRLYNSLTGIHLFSSNEYEIDVVTGQGWLNEGLSYRTPTGGGASLHRFNVLGEGRHFYTANDSEKDLIMSNPATQHYYYEGVAFTVYTPQEGSTEADGLAVVRYFNNYTGSHLYSTNTQEQGILNSSAEWTNEGIAWYGAAV